jgi:Icc-related predicted phosphoesterase
MRRFLICSGIHGDPNGIARIQRVATTHHPDGILFSGGILHPGRECALRSTPWCLTVEDCRFAEQFLATLGNLKVFSAVIPGPAGEPMDEFYRLAMAAELTFPNIHAVHATLVEEGDIAICGIGGTIAEEPLLGTETFTRLAVEYLLRPLWRSDRPRKVLLLAAAPSDSSGWPKGESLVWDMIDSYHPDLCVVYGTSDQQGSLRVGKTLVVNPGSLADGSAAWLDWDRSGEDQVELMNLTAQA